MKSSEPTDEDNHLRDEDKTYERATSSSTSRTGKSLRSALEGSHPPDDKFIADMNGALALSFDDGSHP